MVITDSDIIQRRNSILKQNPTRSQPNVTRPTKPRPALSDPKYVTPKFVSNLLRAPVNIPRGRSGIRKVQTYRNLSEDIQLKFKQKEQPVTTIKHHCSDTKVGSKRQWNDEEEKLNCRKQVAADDTYGFRFTKPSGVELSPDSIFCSLSDLTDAFPQTHDVQTNPILNPKPIAMHDDVNATPTDVGSTPFHASKQRGQMINHVSKTKSEVVSGLYSCSAPPIVRSILKARFNRELPVTTSNEIPVPLNDYFSNNTNKSKVKLTVLNGNPGNASIARAPFSIPTNAMQNPHMNRIPPNTMTESRSYTESSSKMYHGTMPAASSNVSVSTRSPPMSNGEMRTYIPRFVPDKSPHLNKQRPHTRGPLSGHVPSKSHRIPVPHSRVAFESESETSLDFEVSKNGFIGKPLPSGGDNTLPQNKVHVVTANPVPVDVSSDGSRVPPGKHGDYRCGSHFRQPSKMSNRIASFVTEYELRHPPTPAGNQNTNVNASRPTTPRAWYTNRPQTPDIQRLPPKQNIDSCSMKVRLSTTSGTQTLALTGDSWTNTPYSLKFNRCFQKMPDDSSDDYDCIIQPKKKRTVWTGNHGIVKEPRNQNQTTNSYTIAQPKEDIQQTTSCRRSDDSYFHTPVPTMTDHIPVVVPFDAIRNRIQSHNPNMPGAHLIYDQMPKFEYDPRPQNQSAYIPSMAPNGKYQHQEYNMESNVNRDSMMHAVPHNMSSHVSYDQPGYIPTNSFNGIANANRFGIIAPNNSSTSSDTCTSYDRYGEKLLHAQSMNSKTDRVPITTGISYVSHGYVPSPAPTRDKQVPILDNCKRPSSQMDQVERIRSKIRRMSVQLDELRMLQDSKSFLSC